MPTLQIKRGAVSGLPSLSAGQPGFTTDQFRIYVGSAGGNRLLGLFDNIAGTTAPTVNEDAGDGYSVGSIWADTTNDKGYICLDSTVGAAVWQQFSGTGSGGITQLTGDVTAGPGTGSQAATIGNAKVTLAKIANASANSKLLGSGASGSGASYSEITLGTNLSMSGTTLNATGGSGTVTSVASADLSVAVTNGTTTPDLALNPNWLTGRPLVNGYFVTSVSGNAMTITLKGALGNTPSASEPVKVIFPGTAGAAPTTISVTAATSLTISSGSTLGAANLKAFRVWIVGFNDGGTFRIGAVICGAFTQQMRYLRDGAVASSTAEGGAGGADTVNTIYTGTAVTNKQYRVLGYATWESGLTTAGTWAVNATDNVQFGPGTPLPGDVIQFVRSDTGAVATGTTTIPLDATIPQNTEGDQYLSLATTVISAANYNRVKVQGFASNDGTGPWIIMALFRDSVANALASTTIAEYTAVAGCMLSLDFLELAVSATYKVRLGSQATGTTTFNGILAGVLFGGTMNSFLEIQEVMG